LYKEDFEKFADNLNETIDFIKANAPEPDPRENVEVTAEVGVTATAETVETIETQGYSSGVEFDDLIDSKE
jgi:ribulose bisphosphate carboxylase small subunit